MAACVAAVLVAASPAAADDWFPHPADATWTWAWNDSVYNPVETKELVTVGEQKGDAFTLAWTTEGQGNPPEAPSSSGNVSFQMTPGGLLNTNWSSTLPPANFPILCGTFGSCGNSLSSSYYNLIWGSRAPLLVAPLLRGAVWETTGGAQGDVAATSEYVGREAVTVPAFPMPISAAKLRSDITHAGALGDPYGSGVRWTWWVYGVGPVKVVFEHAGGTNAPVTTAVLHATNQVPKPAPADANYFPFRKTLKSTYRWTNSRHLKKPVVQRFTVEEVVNASARISVESVSGPIKVAGSYGFTTRLDGVTNIWGSTKAASLAKLPALGPKALPVARRRHFFTPYDLMTFGFNPLIPAYPRAGERWAASGRGRDFASYGVTGNARIIGVQAVKVPGGSFRALAVRTVMRQAGFPFGSGTRTSWFAPDRGLVKLTFQHGDGSVSRVELLR